MKKLNEVKLEILMQITKIDKIIEEYQKDFENEDPKNQERLRRLDKAISLKIEYKRGLQYALTKLEEASR